MTACSTHLPHIAEREPSRAGRTAAGRRKCAYPQERDKRDVARAFGRAARSYDRAASLQRRVGEALLERLPEPPRDERRNRRGIVLDLGSGTGYFRKRLAEKLPDWRYAGLDIAEGMVRHAAGGGVDGEADWLVGDAEDLPLAAASVHGVFSNLTVQWSERPEALAAEILRVLRPGGWCLLSTLGPGTLRELRESWAAVDDLRHVNRFLPVPMLREAFERAGFDAIELYVERIRLQYGEVGQLLRQLKSLGAHNVNRGRPRGMTGKRALRGMIRAYELHREHGLLPASYEVCYLLARKTIFRSASARNAV